MSASDLVGRRRTLVGPGGQERTPSEYAELLGKAGFKLTQVVPTESAVSIVEAVPV